MSDLHLVSLGKKAKKVLRKTFDANGMNTYCVARSCLHLYTEGTATTPNRQLLTYPQAQEEFLLAARHHATILQHRTDLLQGFGSEQCGLVAEDIDVSVLWHRSEKTLLGQSGRHEGPGVICSQKQAPLHPLLYLTNH